MSQNGGMAAMRATFYGGPADGGVLTLSEPVREHLHFPISHLDALELLEPQAGEQNLVPNVDADYVLELVDGNHPRKDPHGRLRYLYVIHTPPKKETPDAE